MAEYAKSNVKGAFYALGAMGIYATHDVVVKYLGEAGFGAFQIIFFAALLSFPLVTIILMRDTEADNLIPRHPYWMALRMACMVNTGVCAFYAFTVLELAQTYAILFASPLLITILAIPLLGEKVGIHRWLAVIVGLIGVIIVLRPGSSELSLGHFAAMFAAVTNAVVAIISRKIGAEERSVVMLMYPMLGNFAAMAIAMPFVYQPMEIEHLGMTGIIALFGLVASFLFIQAYRSGEAAIVAPMQYIQIIWATVYGYFLSGEKLDAPTVIGASIIIASGIYIVLRETRGASNTKPVSQTRLRSETVTSPRVSVLMRILKVKQGGNS